MSQEIKALDNTIWLMEPGRLAQMIQRAMQVTAWPTHLEIENARKLQAGKPVSKAPGKVAVIQMQGIIEQRMGPMGYMFGGASTEWAEMAINQCLADKSVEAIVLDMDSPGGTSYGVEELSDVLYDASKKKRVYAIANSMACSAAHWIASSAPGKFCVTPGGDCGSVGVFVAHADYTGAMEQEGVKVTIIRTPKYKAEGNPYEPLSADTREHLQQMVDDTYARFVKAVARNRGVSQAKVRDTHGEGRMVPADDALSAGMCDSVLTMSQLMNSLGSSWPDLAHGHTMGMSAEILRMRHEHQKAKIRNV